MGIPVEYHLLFLIMSFILFLVSIFFLFINTTFQKAIAANILIVFNIVLDFLVALGFGAIDFYHFNQTGNLVHNVYAGMHPFITIYWIFAWVNIMLLFYCVYIYLKKPWEDYVRGRYGEEAQYFGEEY